ncbi:MAG: recombinase zinc beta ribbon domain-containing protein, partial [Actinomycetota bacterium]
AAPQRSRVYPFSGRIVCQCGGHLVGTYRNDRDARYYLCSANTNSALTGERCPIPPRTLRADTLEALLWEPIRATLADPGRLLEAAMLHAEHPGPNADQLADNATGLGRRLAEIEAERLRTFRDAKQLGLTNPEIKSLLGQLSADHDELTSELRRLRRQAELFDARVDPSHQARRLASQAAARLDSPNRETQAQLIELLDIRVKRTVDGYEISGAIPIEAPDQAGKIGTRALQHRCQDFAAFTFSSRVPNP